MDTPLMNAEAITLVREAELIHYPMLAYHYKRDNYTPFNGTSAEWLSHHQNPQCRWCYNEIARDLYGDLEGLYYMDVHAYMHMICHAELEAKLAYMLLDKEDGIVYGVQNALRNNGVEAYQGYRPFAETSHKFCVYCDGLLTEDRVGFFYRDGNANILYLHNACYNAISSKPKYNFKAVESDQEARERRRARLDRLFPVPKPSPEGEGDVEV